MMKTNAGFGPPQGWVCGRCNASVAPTERVCPNCVTPRPVGAADAQVRSFEMPGDPTLTTAEGAPE